MIYKVWKPYGITSVQFVKEFQKQIKCEKATCTGRLDPLAQGEMIILTDNDTKKMSGYLKKSKTYQFEMVIGIDSESHDCLSRVINISDESHMNKMDNRYIIKKMHEFIVKYRKQKYPLVSSFVMEQYSNKKPLWWFYKNGYRDIILPEKDIFINNYNIFSVSKKTGKELSEIFMNRIEQIKNKKLQEDLNSEERIFEWKNFKDKNTEFVVISMEMSVCSGFYIRRFCHDFGKYINSYGIALDITRTNIQD
jgi:tRNA U55 pseudouridine synthase TruB